MIVAEQHDIDAREIPPPHTGVPMPRRSEERKRTGAFRPDRISQNVRSGLLDEHRGMVNQRNTQLIARNIRWRLRGTNVSNETGRWFPAAGKLPSQDIGECTHLRSIRIEEPFTVEMTRKVMPHQFHLCTVRDFVTGEGRLAEGRE